MILTDKYKTLLKKNEMDNPLVLAHFMAQLEHESGLKPISENLNYSAEGLLKIFPKYFTVAQAALYARKPEKIANRVYGSRYGNGDEKSGDGWRYRGRGFIQLTFKDNYKSATKDTGVDYVNNPDLLLNEADAMIVAIWFWKKNNLTKYALLDDIETITKRINGGLNGYEHRKQLLIKWKKYFKV